MLQLFLWWFLEEFVEPREVNVVTVEMIGLDTKKKTIENTIDRFQYIKINIKINILKLKKYIYIKIQPKQ